MFRRRSGQHRSVNSSLQAVNKTRAIRFPDCNLSPTTGTTPWIAVCRGILWIISGDFEQNSPVPNLCALWLGGVCTENIAGMAHASD